MNFEQIYSEPDEIKHETQTLKERIKIISTDLRYKKRKAIQNCKTIQLMNESSEKEKQHQDIMAFFKKNIYVQRWMNHMLRKKKVITKNQKEILQLTGDKAAFLLQQQDGLKIYTTLLSMSFFQGIRTMLKNNINIRFIQLIKKIPIIQPENQFKIGLDILGTAARFYFLYLIPIDFAWSSQSILFDNYFSISLLMEIILILEFIFNLNVAYYLEGNLVIDRKLIAKNLIYKYYGLEIFSTIIILLAFMFPELQTRNSNDNPQNLLFLIFVFHTLTIDRTVNQYETALNFGKKLSSYLNLLKLLMFFFYVVHLFACAWYWVGEYNISDEQNWLIRNDAIEDTWFQQYLTSVYFACVTMFTVGYGDITPKTKLEKSFTIIFIILSSIQLPYSVNTVGNIIQQISAYGEERKNKLRTINSYMQRKHVPYNLQNQIRQYLDYYWQLKKNEESEEEKLIISQLPENLRDTLMIKINHSFFNKVPFFRDNFSIAFKQKLLKKINQIVIQPGQIIETQNQINGPQLLYVEEGMIEIYINSKFQNSIGNIQKQQTIEIVNFIKDNQSTQYYKSIGITKLLILSRQDFINTLNEFPDDFETFCKIKDDLIFNTDSLIHENYCSICEQKNHKVTNCPFIHYAPSKDFIIKKFNYYKQQKRRDFTRTQKRTSTYHNLTELEFIQKKKSIIQQTVPQKSRNSINLFPSYITIKESNQNESIDKQKILQPRNNKAHNSTRQKTTMLWQNKLKSTFKNAVNKVIAIQRFLGANDQDNIDKLEISLDCKQIRELLYDMKKQKQVNEKDVEQIEMLLVKTKNFTKYERKGMENFEQLREFCVYGPNYNIKKVIEKLNQCKYQKYFLKKLEKLLPYLQYPGIYIKQYKVKLKHRKLKRSFGIDMLSL